MSSNVLSSPGRQLTVGTGTGLVVGVSKSPWDLRPLALLQESVSSSVRDSTEPNGRFSSFSSSRTLCPVDIQTGQNCCSIDM